MNKMGNFTFIFIFIFCYLASTISHENYKFLHTFSSVHILFMLDRKIFMANFPIICLYAYQYAY